MAVDAQTPNQKRAVEKVIGWVQNYLDARHSALVRIRPEVDRVWDDLVFQGIVQLQLTLSNSKPFGPLRYHVAETLVGDDERRIRDFLSPTHTNSIMAEIVEQEEKANVKKMEGTLEIHDLRTLFKTIEPSFTSLVSLVQTFIWWDFEDAVDLARFDIKEVRVRGYLDGKLTDEARAWYKDMLQLKEQPSDDDIINYELLQMKRSLDNFAARRNGEPGYKRIIARDQVGADSANQVIQVLANHLRMQAHLRGGNPLDATLTQQFSQVLGIDASQVTVERALAFVDRAVAENRTALRGLLNSANAGGKPYSLKPRQEEEVRRRFTAIVGDRKLPERGLSSDRVPKDPSTAMAQAQGGALNRPG